MPKTFLGGLIGTGQSLSYSHNNYEGDGSIGRDDAYINHGDAHSLGIAKFEQVYQVGQPDDRYTLDKFPSGSATSSRHPSAAIRTTSQAYSQPWSLYPPRRTSSST